MDRKIDIVELRKSPIAADTKADTTDNIDSTTEKTPGDLASLTAEVPSIDAREHTADEVAEISEVKSSFSTPRDGEAAVDAVDGQDKVQESEGASHAANTDMSMTAPQENELLEHSGEPNHDNAIVGQNSQRGGTLDFPAQNDPELAASDEVLVEASHTQTKPSALETSAQEVESTTSVATTTASELQHDPEPDGLTGGDMHADQATANEEQLSPMKNASTTHASTGHLHEANDSGTNGTLLNAPTDTCDEELRLAALRAAAEREETRVAALAAAAEAKSAELKALQSETENAQIARAASDIEANEERAAMKQAAEEQVAAASEAQRQAKAEAVRLEELRLATQQEAEQLRVTRLEAEEQERQQFAKAQAEAEKAAKQAEELANKEAARLALLRAEAEAEEASLAKRREAARKEEEAAQARLLALKEEADKIEREKHAVEAAEKHRRQVNPLRAISNRHFPYAPALCRTISSGEHFLAYHRRRHASAKKNVSKLLRWHLRKNERKQSVDGSSPKKKLLR